MKRFFSVCSLALLYAAPHLQAQDPPRATPLPPTSPSNSAAALASKQDAEENFNILKGRMEDITAAQADRDKQISELRRQVDELKSKLDKPAGNFASAEDIKQLATAIQEVDKKREADKELILKEMEKLGQVVSGGSSHSSPTRHTPPDSASPAGDTSPAVNPNRTGFYYTIKKDDTIGLVAQAYREQGIKVTTKQIVDANPNLNPSKLYVGMKVFIPAPAGSTPK